MDKIKIGHVVQLMALLLFVVMALACASQQSVVDDSQGRASGINDGAYIESHADSITGYYDYALN